MHGYVEALRRDSAGLLAAAREADPEAIVEACPAWRPIDLVWHIGEVQHFWCAVVAERLSDPSGYLEPSRPESADETFAFAQNATQSLLDALASAEPSTAVWTWSSQHDVAFVARRMAHEAAVHRVDAERVAGREWRMPADVAADGIDEFLVHFLPRAVGGGAPALEGSVHVHCADVEGEWNVIIDADGGYTVTRDHAKGDAALRGDAHDLLMILWRRAHLDAVTVFGDRGIAERLVARTNLE